MYIPEVLQKVEKGHGRDQTSTNPGIVTIDSATIDDSAIIRMYMVEQELLKHTNPEALLRMSEKLRMEIEACCHTGTDTMLPSYVDHFAEQLKPGKYLSLEVGGSTLHAALVQLQEYVSTGRPEPKILTISSWPMDGSVKHKSSTWFFRWIAQHTIEMLSRHNVAAFRPQLKDEEKPLAISLTWSFPFEQTAIDRGLVLRCGKGFTVFDSLIGSEISSLITAAFRDEGLDTKVICIVNDVVAGLLAANYFDPLTYCSVVLGTGLNAAIPISSDCLSQRKFPRGKSQHLLDRRYLLVNTELSLLGKDVFPRTQWDDGLISQLRPGVCHQPLEYFSSGYYLGEIVRLILVETMSQDTPSSEQICASFERPFCLESSLMAIFEEDDTPELEFASTALADQLDLDPKHPPSLQDLLYIKNIARCVSRRATAYVAVCIDALCEYARDFVKNEWDSKGVPATMRRSVNVSGAVFERYPQFRETCEGFLSTMHYCPSMDSISYDLKMLPDCTTIGAVIGAAAICTMPERDKYMM